MKKVFCLFITAVMLFTLVIGCAQQSTPTPTPTPAPATSPSPSPNGDEQGASTPEGLEDGQYVGQSDKDERGNYGIVRLKIEDNKITEVIYEEYDGTDKLKSREGGYTYEEALEAFEDLPDQLVEAQDVDEIDDYTGATGTTNKFRTAAKRALAAEPESE